MCDQNPPRTPSSANQNFQIDWLKMVLHTRDDGQQFFDDALLRFVEMGYHDDVISAIEHVDVKKLVDSSGLTLLHHAVAAGSCEIVKYLVDRGCEVDALNGGGRTPLLYAVANQCLPVISILLESNADVFLCAQGGPSPLHFAFDMTYQATEVWTLFAEALKRKYSADSRKIARALLDNNCGVYHAVLLKDVAITRHMLDAGCNVNDRDRFHCTAMHFAVECMDLDNVKLLLDRGGDIYDEVGVVRSPLARYKGGRENSYEMLTTLLNHFASLTDNDDLHYELAEVVLAHGRINEVEALLSRYDFDFTVWNWEGTTLLHRFALNEHDGAMRLLEGKEFDVDTTDREGRTALWDAGMFCNLSALEFLFESGADPNVVDQRGETTLFSALKAWIYFIVSSKQPRLRRTVEKCLELFLEHDADVQHEIPDGDTILHVALMDNQFWFIRPVIAQVAMIEASGRNIKENILQVFDGNERYKKFFNICRQKIEKLQKTMINDKVTLFQFLIDPEEKLLMYARNRDSLTRLEKIIRRERRSKIFFVKRLRKRVGSIIEMVKLREKAALKISEITGIKNHHIIERIVLLLDEQSLKNLREI